MNLLTLEYCFPHLFLYKSKKKETFPLYNQSNVGICCVILLSIASVIKQCRNSSIPERQNKDELAATIICSLLAFGRYLALERATDKVSP